MRKQFLNIEKKLKFGFEETVFDIFREINYSLRE